MSNRLKLTLVLLVAGAMLLLQSFHGHSVSAQGGSDALSTLSTQSSASAPIDPDAQSSASAAMSPDAPSSLSAERTAGERVAILTFWAFDQQGNVIPRASEADLAKLAALMPRAIAAKLVQSGTYEVLDDPLLEAYNAMPLGGPLELDRVQQLLDSGNIDQVIVGNIAQVQQAVVTSSRRYVLGPDGPRIEGAAVVRSNNASEAVNSVESLLTQMFPPDSDVVPRPIARIVAVPNVLRIPIGGSVPVQAYAMDDLGRTLSTVTLVFQTNNEATVLVDADGNVTGVRPGQAQVNIQALGRPLAPNVQPPRIDVSVIGPSLGLRAGTGLISGHDSAPRIGLRLTPAHEIKTSNAPQQLPQAGSNPVTVLTSFFGALIGNQMLTIDLDIVPKQDISMVLNAVQRTARTYFGTGVGVAVPMGDEGTSGVILRLTLGSQLPFKLGASMTLPIEFTADFILGGANSAAQARIGASIGIDLFQ